MVLIAKLVVKISIEYHLCLSNHLVFNSRLCWNTFLFQLQMWKYMESAQPTVFVKNYEQGIKRVKKGNYAFLMESTVLDYVVQVNQLILISVI